MFSSPEITEKPAFPSKRLVKGTVWLPPPNARGSGAIASLPRSGDSPRFSQKRGFFPHFGAKLPLSNG
jgi:hypothetical protein